MSKLYLYLARRDKHGIKVVKVITTDQQSGAVRVADIKRLGLPDKMTQEIQVAVDSNKMDYELWAETASDFMSLRSSLIARGYRNIAMNEPVMHPEFVFKAMDKSVIHRCKTMMKPGKSRS